MKTAVYLRVSTSDKGQSTDRQKLDLEAYAKQRGWEITDIFEDIGISGSKDSRPGLNKLMEAVRANKVEVVLVWSFSRFARSTKHLLLVLEEFNDLGVAFVSQSESVNTATAQGKLLYTILSAFAEFERDLISERVKSGLRAAKANGKRLGRKIVKNDPRIIPLHCQGLSSSQIARQLEISPSSVQRTIRWFRI